MTRGEALEFVAEFDAQKATLHHACRELLAQVNDPHDLATIEEACRIAYRALATLSRVADRTRPSLTVVR